ncbi:relaxase/mobilization nuclease domain-containing protein [Lachnospiraceae bacterium WCA-693-APC-MOT-I]|uniref:Relaxase/mobilization nuclease domain-containing protein n=2 Tax=Velocimicrobium porci TaxID=2606634 RepID=A0A6L5Y0C1_9FIRM|nr:relaxase/mobilization nuclease domain-containing protein [Velocimicrobium porci]
MGKKKGGDMAEGIVIKIWNVKASSSTRSGASQIQSSIDYIENPEKVCIRIADSSQFQMGNELTYVMNDIKTVDGLYVGARHITDIKNATEEMMQIKEFYGKLDGRVATHGVISLDVTESDPKNAGKLMLLLDELMQKVFPDNQVVYAVHTNTENLHIHFILNTVGLYGKKIHMDNDFMSKVLEPAVNELAEKYGFTPNEKWNRKKRLEDIPLPQRKMILRGLIDNAIEQTDDFAAFIAYLRADGLTVNVGKNLSLQMDGMQRAMRTGQLGKNYTIEGICQRLSTKMDPLVWKSISEEAHYISEKEMLLFTPSKMKNYSDMNQDEKKEAVRMLRLGRNPWEETRNDNWQIQRMSKQLNEIGYVYELVHYYSRGVDNAELALSDIISRRKNLSEERKEIRENLKAYKPIISIYEEMKKYMIRAYLYDAYGRTEYIEDFKRYQELSDRLMNIYGKSVEEVADYIADQKAQLIYAKAQDTELNDQYKIIKNYLDNKKFEVDERGLSFFKAVGHSEAKREAREYGIFASDMKYITAKDVEDIIVRVVTTPDVIDGKNTVTTTVTVLTNDEKVVKEISSKYLDAKAFNDALFELSTEYDLRECQTHRKNIRKNAL